jgi:UDP-N-acetylmuramoyl-L-alanyl-D-glutamate--2,6-diaminopimelate ligase
MRLGDLVRAVDDLELVAGSSDIEIDDVALDSRLVTRGSLFCCITGSVADGHDHVAAALTNGAAAVLVERQVPELDNSDVAVLRVLPGHARRATALAAAEVAGHPSRKLAMVGVTGTNGKTTIVTLLGAVLESTGHAATVIGTLTGARTTPSAPELQHLLRAAVERAALEDRPGAVAMEVSSHALDQHRTDGVVFDVAVFTNLSHDHLDYHGSMANYLAAKAKLFATSASRMAVIWAATDAGREILAGRGGSSVAVSFDDATDVTFDEDGIRFSWRNQAVSTSLVGTTGLIDALLVLEAAVALGVDPAAAAAGLAVAGGVPGRMERVSTGDDQPTVIVDYAHTPDALAAAIDSVAALRGPTGRTFLVFGCGGDRDERKRPLMGAVAAERADVAVVTTDNPRHESPAAIAEAVAAGAPAGVLEIILDRRAAIASVLDRAGAGDVVLIAGKGHEATQQVGDEVIELDDRVVAAAILAEGSQC